MNDMVKKDQHEISVSNDASAIMSVIERIVMNPDVDISKVEKMLDMQERIMNRNAEQSFNSAMTIAQGEMGRVSADMQNPQTRSMYASYAQLDRSLRPVYTKHGFSLSFDTGELNEGILPVKCYVSHKDGHSRTYHVDMPADGLGAKGNAVMTKTHAAGSAMSYGMRYLLKLIFNVAIGEDDDDGNGAEGIITISEEQEANIVAMLDETDSKKSDFLKYLGVESLLSLPASHYDKAIKALEAKRTRMSKGE